MRIKALKQSSKFRFSSIFCDAHCEPHAARHHRSFWRAPQLIQCNLSPKFQQPSIGWMIRTRITLQALPRSPLLGRGAACCAPACHDVSPVASGILASAPGNAPLRIGGSRHNFPPNKRACESRPTHSLYPAFTPTASARLPGKGFCLSPVFLRGSSVPSVLNLWPCSASLR
jgi:hypothetical protein